MKRLRILKGTFVSGEGMKGIHTVYANADCSVEFSSSANEHFYRDEVLCIRFNKGV